MSNIVYTGLIFFLELSTEPKFVVRVTEDEMDEEHWLVNFCVKHFPRRKNYTWHGACIVLSPHPYMSLDDFNPDFYDTPGVLIYECDDMHLALLAHPKYRKFEVW
jgi:hypothetical protein